MSRLNASNNARTLLSIGINDSAVTMTVDDGSVFPDAPFRITIHKGDPAAGEIIEVGSKSGNTLSSLLRAQEGTAAAAWDAADFIDLLGTAGMYNELFSDSEFQAHWTNARPHQLTDERDATVYNYGFKIDSDGVMVLVLEEA